MKIVRLLSSLRTSCKKRTFVAEYRMELPVEIVSGLENIAIGDGKRDIPEVVGNSGVAADATVATEGVSESTRVSEKKVKMSVYFHPTCSKHNIPDHPEHYSRVDGILATLKKTWPADLTFRESKMVTKDQILAFHTPSLLGGFLKLADKALQSYEKNKKVEYLNIDMDTTVMWRTKAAVLHSAGSVISALDHMYAAPTDVNKIDTAFCCVRPPGHHAERDKSGGFCFINNVAIGAKHAQKTHGVERVAILDYDVHHGNGTEEGFTDDPTVFYGSTHGRDHYPGTGHDPSPFVGDQAKKEVDRRIVNRLLTPGPKSRDDFRIKWTEILSEMERFQPQLVIMSSGFDAHDDDPLAECELTDEDFAWVTSAILASCARVTQALDSEVRYLSVLEGGYDIPAIQRSAVCHVQAMLQGLPTLPSAPKETATSAGKEDVDGPEDSCVVVQEEEGVASLPVVEKEDGELVALREYLESFGIEDTKPPA